MSRQPDDPIGDPTEPESGRKATEGGTSPTPEGPSAPEDGGIPPTREIGPRASGPGQEQAAAYWETIEASGEFQPGQLVFNRYIVRQKIGRGGMGAVWLVTHRELNTDRALKTIVAGIAYDSQARARFRREAQLMAQFSHPNAVTVHDARLTEQDVAYIDMEFVEGQSLEKVIRRGEPMPLPWIVRVLDQLCDVLDVAHRKGIVHRDLKPANLMLVGDRPHGRELLKVLDFGIAKILGDVESAFPRTRTGVFMGTPPYASPEQADGKADIRSDIYSVGVILYEFLTGFRPFTGVGSRVIVDTIATAPPAFSQANPAVEYPDGVEALVMRCLSKEPDDRPQSATEVAEAFRAALSGPSPSPVDKIPYDAPPAVRRRVPVIAPLMITGVILLAAIGWMMWPTSRADRGESGPALPPGYASAGASDPADGYPRVIQRDGVRFMRIGGREDFHRATGDDATARTFEPQGIEIPDFYLQESEVTNRQFLQFAEKTSTIPPRVFSDAYDALVARYGEEAGEHPAVGIPHALAEKFAAWAGGSLPTSDQWEYAARSGGLENRPHLWAGPHLSPEDDRAGVNLGPRGQGSGSTRRAATSHKDLTEQGVFDLAGNVREWCRDPAGEAGRFVVRGGSWQTPAERFTTSSREDVAGTEALDDLGFRVAIEWPRGPGGPDGPRRPAAAGGSTEGHVSPPQD